MRGLAFVLLLALASATLPPAQAALTTALPFEATSAFMDDLGTSGAITLTSGAVQVSAPQVQGSLGLLGVEAFTLGGLSEVCWQAGNGIPECSSGAYAVEVAAGSSVGLCFPSAVAAAFEADHAISLFVDFSADDDLNTLPVNRSLVAPSVGGRLDLHTIPAIADAVLSNNPCATSGAIVALDANTTMTLRSADSPNPVQQVVGKAGRFIFAGSPTVAPLGVGLIVLPFGPTAQAEFGRSPQAAADEGLDPDRLAALVGILDQSHAGNTTKRDSNVGEKIEELPAAVRELLNGAFLTIPAREEGQGQPDPTQIIFARFTHLSAATAGPAIHYEGAALLAAGDGHIAHSHKLVGISILSLPWLGVVLWVVALAVWIVRLSLHPEKHSRWDSLRWIGWIATPLAVLLVFFLVDLEVRYMVGSSFLSGSEGKARLVYFLMDVGFLGILGLVAGGPLRIILRNSFLLARQGTFMGLAGSIATVLSFFIAVTFFRDYLDLAFSQVVSKLA